MILFVALLFASLILAYPGWIIWAGCLFPLQLGRVVFSPAADLRFEAGQGGFFPCSYFAVPQYSYINSLRSNNGWSSRGVRVRVSPNCHGFTQLPWVHPTVRVSPNWQGFTQLSGFHPTGRVSSNSQGCTQLSGFHPIVRVSPNWSGFIQLPGLHPTVRVSSNSQGCTQLSGFHPTVRALPNCQGFTLSGAVKVSLGSYGVCLAVYHVQDTRSGC